MKNKRVRLGTVFFLVVATAIIAAVGTYFYVSRIVNDIGTSQQMYLNLSNVEQIVVSNYINKIDTATGYNDIQNGIISGYINGLNDSLSYYLDEKNYSKDMYSQSSTQIESGIHPTYDKSTGGVMVLFVKKDSPAYLSGIKSGDIITSLDGVSVNEIGYKNTICGLSRDPGTACTVDVLRSDTADVLSFTINFEPYTINTVSYKFLGNNIGYIYINEFDKTTLAAFKEAYSVLSLGDENNEPIKNLIIDIRNNADGDFLSMIDVATYIMPGTSICTRRERDSSHNMLYTASSDNYIDMNMVILQNSKTSGVSEVFAAALRDNNIAVIIGDTSSGTGLAQREIPLSNSTAIVLSVYEYITPSGASFNGTGIIPNYQSKLDNAKFAKFPDLDIAEDDQLQYAISYLLVNAE